MKDTLYKYLNMLFTITMILFVLMTAMIVLVQIVGIAAGNGGIVLGINDALKTCAIWVSTVCGLIAMIAHNFMPKKKKSDNGPVSIGPAKDVASSK